MRKHGTAVSLAGLLQAFAVITIVLSVVTLLHNPHRYIELLCHFRLQYLIATVFLLVAFVALKNIPWSAALLVTAVLNASLVIPWYLPIDQDTSANPGLKFIHANVYSRNNQYEKVASLVAREDPDLIFLQEVTEDWLTAMRKLLPDHPYYYAEPRSGNFGIAVFSKNPFDSVTHVDTPPLSYPTIVMTMMTGENSTTIVSSHPTIPISRSLTDARNAHIRSIAELVRASPGDVVLLGDFNESMWGPQYRGLLGATGLKAARRGFGVVPTWPTFFPIAMIPIDHVFVSPGIGVEEFRTGKRIGSDHLPLIVTLSL